MSDGKNRFGGANKALLDHVAKSAAASISVADAGSREAFLDAWAQTLSEHARHLRSVGKQLAAPVVLVHVDDTGIFCRKHDGWIARSLLGTSPRDPYEGTLAVGTGGTGGAEHPNRFADTRSVEDEIRRVGLQRAPTIALFTESRLHVWPEGIDGDVDPYQRGLDGGPVVLNLNSIDRDLNHFHEVIARQTRAWWKNAHLRVTVDNPEAAVQYALWVFLMAKYSHVARIKTEETIGNGRSDITAYPLDTSGGNQSAVLELKALRQVRTPKQNTTKPKKISESDNIKWAGSGLQQTATYRDDNKMNGAFLCLYDFCEGDNDAVLKAVTPSANQYGIIARRYWITASHAEHREQRYPLNR